MSKTTSSGITRMIFVLWGGTWRMWDITRAPVPVILITVTAQSSPQLTITDPLINTFKRSIYLCCRNHKELRTITDPLINTLKKSIYLWCRNHKELRTITDPLINTLKRSIYLCCRNYKDIRTNCPRRSKGIYSKGFDYVHSEILATAYNYISTNINTLQRSKYLHGRNQVDTRTNCLLERRNWLKSYFGHSYSWHSQFHLPKPIFLF